MNAVLLVVVLGCSSAPLSSSPLSKLYITVYQDVVLIDGDSEASRAFITDWSLRVNQGDVLLVNATIQDALRVRPLILYLGWNQDFSLHLTLTLSAAIRRGDLHYSAIRWRRMETYYSIIE